MPKRLILVCLLCLFTTFGVHAQQTTEAGKAGSFLLALSWSPRFCLQHGKDAAARSECRGATAYGFIAHGLWPEDDQDAALSSCRPAGPLSPRLLDRMMPIMPSPGLIAHEWTAHGRCSGLSADDYFDRLSQAFLKVQIPDRLQHPRDPIVTDPIHLKRWFQEANPGLRTDMLSIHCDRRDGALQEIRFCVGQNLQFRPCPAPETDRCPAGGIRIDPLLR